MGKDIATQLVEFAIGTKYEDIPQEVIDYTKRLTLKTISGMIAGSTKPSGQKMAGIMAPGFIFTGMYLGVNILIFFDIF